MQSWLRLILLPVLFLFVSCSQKSLSLFFDLPAPPPEKVVQTKKKDVQTKTTTSKQPSSAAQQSTKTEPVNVIPLSVMKMEKAKSWKEAEKLLPKNKLEQRDWVLALNQSIIQPRIAIGGARTPEFVFKFDFYLRGPDPAFDAYFPHSTHTRLLDCASCHPKLFRYRGTKITMDDIDAGKFCGFCHGKVAFPPSPENCGRCHTALAGE